MIGTHFWLTEMVWVKTNSPYSGLWNLVEFAHQGQQRLALKVSILRLCRRSSRQELLSLCFPFFGLLISKEIKPSAELHVENRDALRNGLLNGTSTAIILSNHQYAGVSGEEEKRIHAIIFY